MNPLQSAITQALSDVETFSRLVLNRPLRPYQLDPARAAAHVIPRAAVFMDARRCVLASGKSRTHMCADGTITNPARTLPIGAEVFRRTAQIATEYTANEVHEGRMTVDPCATPSSVRHSSFILRQLP